MAEQDLQISVTLHLENDNGQNIARVKLFDVKKKWISRLTTHCIK